MLEPIVSTEAMAAIPTGINKGFNLKPPRRPFQTVDPIRGGFKAI